jgi:hypothetical protein
MLRVVLLASDLTVQPATSGFLASDFAYGATRSNALHLG